MGRLEVLSISLNRIKCVLDKIITVLKQTVSVFNTDVVVDRVKTDHQAHLDKKA